MKKLKIWTVIGIVGILLLLFTFISPLLIMYYAEEQYFVDQYKKNKTAFENVKNELLLILETEKETELNLVVCYNTKNGRLLQRYDSSAYSVDYTRPIDANDENYDAIDNAFSDFSLSKIYVTQNYICFSEEGNNYQYIYSLERKPNSAHYAPQDNDKIHELGNNWYLITPN